MVMRKIRLHFSTAFLPLIAASLATSCGSASLPASPSAVIAVQSPTSMLATTAPSVVGAWRGFVRAHAVRAGSGTAVGFVLSCSQTWEVATQSGGRFEGQLSSQGSSPESDWRCTQSRRFSGEVTSDDRVTISFEPEFKVGGCTTTAGGERATGTPSGDSIVVTLPYRAMCEMSPGVRPPWDLDIAATITLTPR
jgi:hypothetical protein